MDSSGNDCAVRSHHESSHFGIDGDISHSCGNKDLLIYFAYILTDDSNVIGSLVGFVCDTYTAGEIDEPDVGTGLFLKFDGKFKEL